MTRFLNYTAVDSTINWERIDTIRQRLTKRQASLCSQRAVFYTQSFQESEGEPYIVRKAKAFAYTLEHMDLYIEPDSLFFGNQASKSFAAPIFPEYSIEWVIDELDGRNGATPFEQRTGDRFECDEATKKALYAIEPYWKGKTHQDQVQAHLSDTIRQAAKQGTLHLGGISMSGDGHIVIDHEMLLEKGLLGLIERAKKRQKIQKDPYDQAVEIVLTASLAFCERYACLLEDMANLEADPIRKKELEQMTHIAKTMLRGKARSFYEAIESVYMLHVLQMIESNGHSFCFGRFDQYMEPYYTEDLKRGTLNQDKALELITHFFLLCSTNNKVRPYGHTRFSQGYPLYSNLVVGGLKKDGSDGTNPLSYLCMEAMHQTRLAEPNFSMRYHARTPKPLLERAALLIRTGCGMPSLFNDEVAIKGLLDLGVDREDAYDYCPIGCVETGVPGKYGHRATGMTYVNWGKVLEIVLYHGKDPQTGIQLLSLKENYETYEQVWEAWEMALRFYSDLAVECDKICDASLEIYDADPLASCLIANSFELQKTLKEGGCKYDIISQSNIGPCVVGNSLAAIKQKVFEEKVVSWNEMIQAMEDNWKSASSKRIQKLLLAAPKFGNDEVYVDQIVSDVFESYLKLLPHYTSLRTGKGPKISAYTMSTSNITSYVPNGLDVGATPDGREARAPLNEGCSPVQGTDRNGPGAVINSVSRLPNSKVAAGQLLNMRFAFESLEGEENLERFLAFLRVSQQKGIYHNQFNIHSSQLLKEAQKYPQQHQDLIVRVAGYCAQFVSLMPEAQDAIIARTENQW
ncbi:glycyl radical protein [Dubosiella newyorkensis]|uniref:glycyl radical protein n=1 Tax=Dubosiella newyorkensis TaxID=1862672 RepID=UPI00272AC665|nr:formate C-acetyltransferase/glycerol dehydratase family glycyl radical enzyme [Dubosiella newyorkensis]